MTRKKIDLLSRASISLDWLRNQCNIFAVADPEFFLLGAGEIQILVQKGLLNFFVSNYLPPTPPPTSHWEGRDDYVFLNQWKLVAVGVGITAVPKDNYIIEYPWNLV